MANPEIDNHVVTVERPQVALAMAEDFFFPIFGGEKCITIRKGWRDYHHSEKVVLYRAGVKENDPGWAIMARITSVRHYALKEVPIQDLKDDGMATLEDAVKCLKSFYPDITEDWPVTVIRWELI